MAETRIVPLADEGLGNSARLAGLAAGELGGGPPARAAAGLPLEARE